MTSIPRPFLFLVLAVAIVTVISMWKVFTKAGKPGWASIVPFYNIVVMIEISGRPMWNFAMLFVPFANIVFLFFIYIDLAKSFGKEGGFGVGLALLGFVFWPLLAFGNAAYMGPAYTPEPARTRG